MKLAAALVVLTLAGQQAEPPARRYTGVAAVTAPGPSAPTPALSGASQTQTVEPAAPSPVADPEVARVPPPRPDPEIDPTSRSGLTGRRSALQRVGVGAIILGAGGYAAMVVGLGLGAAADDALAPLRGRDDIERRRELVARGELGNRLALGAGIAAGVVFAVGVALLAVARRRGRTPAAVAQRRPAP